MSYTKLEEFLVKIIKNQENLNKTEKECLTLYHNTVMLQSRTLCGDKLDFCINIRDVLASVHSQLTINKMYIVCLKFGNPSGNLEGDGNKIYIWKEEIIKIPFFGCALEGMNEFDDVIVDFPLEGIANNYKNMSRMIDYFCRGRGLTDLDLVKDVIPLAKLDNYLLGVPNPYCKNKNTTFGSYLKELFVRSFEMRVKIGNVPDDYFNDVCDICDIFGMKIYDIMQNLGPKEIIKYKGALLNSKIMAKLKNDDSLTYDHYMVTFVGKNDLECL